MATYFVLRLDGMGSDWHHINACREAARAYAECILEDCDAEHLHVMAKQLSILVDNLEKKGG